MGLQAVFAIGSLVFQTVSAFAKAGAAQDAADEASDIARENNQLQQQELTRQQQEENVAAREQRNDRIRQANAELGALRVAAGDSGLAGTTFSGLAFDLAYTEGLDLSRINKNRDSRIEALQSDKEQARLNAKATITSAQRKASSAKSAAFIGLAGGAFSTIGDAFNSHQQQKSATNTVT